MSGNSSFDSGRINSRSQSLRMVLLAGDKFQRSKSVARWIIDENVIRRMHWEGGSVYGHVSNQQVLNSQQFHSTSYTLHSVTFSIIVQ